MRFLFICIIASLCGCALGYRVSHVHGTITGTNVQTPYGPATGNLQYEATTCLGNCPKECAINAENH